ncbi:MAG TPA: transposase [Verrucomicrobiae bacterium]
MTTFESRTNQRPATSTMLRLAVPAAAPLSKPQTLVHSVQQAMREVDAEKLFRVAWPSAGIAYQPKILLAILCYCYASEIYGSHAVEDVMRRDVSFRQLCHEEFPGPGVIRRFRKHNREALQRALGRILQSMAEQKVADGTVTRVDSAQIAEEATRRVTMAMFIDSMELDGF